METLQDLCRICLCVNADINLFDEESSFGKLLEKFVICTEVMISIDDSLPKCICQACVNKLNEAFRLREMAQDADKGLRERLENFKVETDFDSSESANYESTLVEEEYLLPESKTQSNGNEKNEWTEANKMHKNTPIKKKYKVRPDKNVGYETNIAIVNFTDFVENVKSDVSPKLRRKKKRIYKKDHMCDICGKSFHHNAGLNTHKRYHTGTRPFTCSFCGKSFTLKSHMDQHISAIHLKLKPYECKVCLKHYAYPRSLIDHKLRHAGHKKYQCTICNMDFYRNYDLGKHQLSHMDINLYACKHCDRSYKDRAVMRRHVRKNHPGQPTEKWTDFCTKIET